MLILWLAIKPGLRLRHIGSALNSHGRGWDHTCHAGTSSDHQRHISWRGERREKNEMLLL